MLRVRECDGTLISENRSCRIGAQVETELSPPGPRQSWTEVEVSVLWPRVGTSGHWINEVPNFLPILPPVHHQMQVGIIGRIGTTLGKWHPALAIKGALTAPYLECCEVVAPTWPV